MAGLTEAELFRAYGLDTPAPASAAPAAPQPAESPVARLRAELRRQESTEAAVERHPESVARRAWRNER